MLLISNDGQLLSNNGYLGYSSGSSNNSASVTGYIGFGSRWVVFDDLAVGEYGSGNNLLIRDRGDVFVVFGNSYVGHRAGSNKNSVEIGGVGSLWSNACVYVGYEGSDNSVRLSGGLLLATNLTIGFASAACDNRLQLESGAVTVTNETTTAVFEVRRGTLILNGGTLQVDRFVMTNACAQFIRTGGTLIYGSAVLTTNFDADGDGMANGWEQASGLDPLNAADAGADNDGDGFTNLQEFQTGTNPTNASSAFRVLSLESTNDDMLVTWQAGGGRTNVVQSAPDLTGSYSNTSPNILLTGSGDTTTNWLDTGGARNGVVKFYRIRLVP